MTALIAGGWLAVFLGVVVGFHLWAPHVVRQFQVVLAETSNNTLVYSREDTLLATIAGLEDRHTIPISKINPYLLKAVVAVEDHRFFNHRGMDPIRLAGALWANIHSMAYYQGGSTITQQLVKLTLLSPERTLTRKVKEIFMAAALEKEFPKLKLLEFYLNRVYLGNGLYGVEKAAQAYFKKPAEALTLSEAAFLAALIKKPQGYLLPAVTGTDPKSPVLATDGLKPLLRRRAFVLKLLGELGWVARAEIEAAKKAKLVVYRPVSEIKKAPYFVQEVLKELRLSLGISRVAGRGYRVYTTLDPRHQRAAEKTIADFAAGGGQASQASLIAMDPRSGFVNAMVGGVDFATSQFNRATQARRQPGSAFKPILYAAALEKGFSPNTVFVDEPIRYVWGKDGLHRLKGPALARGTEEGLIFGGGPDSAKPEILDVYEPRNYNDTYGARYWPAETYPGRERRMTMAKALERSSNVIAVQVLDRLGMQHLVRLSTRLDLAVRPEMGLCVALGCSETSLISLTAAYGSFANGGLRTRPVLIRKVTNLHGDVIFEHIPELPEQVISPWTAFQMNRMLQAVIQRGTGTRARLGRAAGGKTGTNDGPRDAWFIGFTPGLVAGVWIGNDDNQVMPGETGGRTPARLWAKFMGRVPQAPGVAEFPVPPRASVAVRTCTVSGQVANGWCPNPKIYHYRKSEAPAQVCHIHGPAEIALRQPPAALGMASGGGSFASRLGEAFAETSP